MTLTMCILLLGAVTLADAAPRIQVHGHRGARAVRPENTMPAFEYAIEVGVDVLELDLNVTKDGVLVVAHDPTMNLKICKGPAGETAIHKLTLAQVREWDCGTLKNPDFKKQQPVPGTKIPTFDEVLALAPKGAFWFNIETKSDPKHPDLQPEPRIFAQLVADAVRKHKLEKRVIIQSFDYRTLIALKEIAPELPRAALYEGFPKDLVEISKEAGDAQFVSPHYLLITKAKVQKAQKAGVKVVPWTANSAGVWDRMIGYGVDAIISDDPGALIEHLKAKGLR
jgi:glycerophosphoryl diester phosphodiesterase